MENRKNILFHAQIKQFFSHFFYLFCFNFFYNFKHIFYSSFYTTKQEENNTNFLIFYFFLIIQFEKKKHLYIFYSFSFLIFLFLHFFPINQPYSFVYNNNNFKPLHVIGLMGLKLGEWSWMMRLKPDAATVHMHWNFFYAG